MSFLFVCVSIILGSLFDIMSTFFWYSVNRHYVSIWYPGAALSHQHLLSEWGREKGLKLGTLPLTNIIRFLCWKWQSKVRPEHLAQQSFLSGFVPPATSGIPDSRLFERGWEKGPVNTAKVESSSSPEANHWRTFWSGWFGEVKRVGTTYIFTNTRMSYLSCLMKSRDNNGRFNKSSQYSGIPWDPQILYGMTESPRRCLSMFFVYIQNDNTLTSNNTRKKDKRPVRQ